MIIWDGMDLVGLCIIGGVIAIVIIVVFFNVVFSWIKSKLCKKKWLKLNHLKQGENMKIKFEKFVIATKSFPLEFDDGTGDTVDDMEYAILYETEGNAEIELERFDEPDQFQILPVKVTYEL